MMLIIKTREERKEETRSVYEKARVRLYAYNTSAKPPKKAPARARTPKVCPNCNADAALESALLKASELLLADSLPEVSSAELLSSVADAPPKPE